MKGSISWQAVAPLSVQVLLLRVGNRTAKAFPPIGFMGDWGACLVCPLIGMSNLPNYSDTAAKVTRKYFVCD
jgi:hypothetical protein